jgi:hypothetical protein
MRKRSVRIPFVNFFLENLNGGDVGVDGRILLKCPLMESGVWGCGWVHNRHDWWNVLNVICGIFVSSQADIYFCLAEGRTILPFGGT